MVSLNIYKKIRNDIDDIYHKEMRGCKVIEAMNRKIFSLLFGVMPVKREI